MSILLKLKSSFFTKSKIRKICFIGLDHAGKSSVIKRIIDEEFNEHNNKRTVGMEVAKFEVNGLEFIAWDIGGQKAFRETVWQTYLQGSKAVIYVIDSTDKNRIYEAQHELEKYVFKNTKFAPLPILILANKQDLSTSLSCEDIRNLLNLDKIQSNSVKIFGISCKTGLNIVESFNWLSEQINSLEKNMCYNPSQSLFSVKI